MNSTDEKDGTPAERIESLRATNAAIRVIGRARAAAAESVRQGRGKTPADLAMLWVELQPVTPLDEISANILALIRTATNEGRSVRARTVAMKMLKAIGWDVGTFWGHPVATHAAHNHDGRLYLLHLVA